MERKSLPPGFRFHPTDVELVMYYLKRKVMGKKLHAEAIADVDIYRFSPWDLPDMSCLKSKDLEWFFFCPKEKKYARGVRVKRATEKGYWKTTGKDRNVLYGEKIVGTIKTLVFHFGHAPKGERTDWVIHEYKIIDAQLAATGLQDTYVLCKVFKKNGPGPKVGAQYGAPFTEEDWSDDDVNDSEIRAASSIPDVLPSTALTPEKRSCISTGSLIPEITSGASETKKCSNADQTCTISAQFLPGSASGPSTALTPEKQSCISTGSLIPEINSCSLATKECSNVFQQYAITGHFHPGSASGSVHPGSACGSSLGEGLQLPAGPTSSQLLDQEFGDDIDRFLASFTDDPLLLENGQHEDDLNGMGMPCLDGNGIYSGLQSLNNISIPVDEPRFGLSGMPQDDHNSSLNMLMQDSSGYIELDDLAVPLDFSTEAFGNGQLYDAAAVGSYSDGNMPQFCVSGINHPPPCIDQLPMLSNQSHQDNQFCLGSDAEYDPYTYGQSSNGQNAGLP